MNSESPFRSSRIVLTVGCILCGISASSYFAAQFAPRRNSVDQTTVAGSAQQVNVSEFQTTSAESGLSSCESEGHAVPHFSLPVTAHPEIVPVDHADIIREISRVHERLDLLSAEARTAHSRQTPHHAAVIAPVQHSGVQPDESSSQKKVHDVPSAAPTAAFCETFLPNSVANPAMATAVMLPPVSVPEPMPEFQFETSPSQPVADIPIFGSPATEPETFEPETFEPETFEPETFEPETFVPETFVPETFVPETFVPETFVPETFVPETFEPETFVPEEMDSASILSIEFMPEAFAIPEPKDASGVPRQNDAQFLEIPISDFSDSIAYAAAPVPVEWPPLRGVATLAVPSSQSAKRTTDPPFMNGRSQRIPTPPAQVANGPAGTVKIGAVQPVSRMQPARTSPAAGIHTTQTDCKKCKVAKQGENQTDRIQAVPLSQTFRRIISTLTH